MSISLVVIQCISRMVNTKTNNSALDFELQTSTSCKQINFSDQIGSFSGPSGCVVMTPIVCTFNARNGKNWKHLGPRKLFEIKKLMLFPLPGVLKNAFPRRTREILNSLAHLTVFASAKEQGVNCNPTKVKHLFFDFIIKNHECRSVLIYPGTWLSTESRHKNTHSAAFFVPLFPQITARDISRYFVLP